MIVKEDDNGYVYLCDVVCVMDIFEDWCFLVCFDGELSVMLVINKDCMSNMIIFVQEICDIVDCFEECFLVGMYMCIVDDMLIEVKSCFGGLYSNLLFGFVFVIVVIWIFIGIWFVLMVVVGILVVFLFIFVMIQVYGFLVNMLVFFSLILVIGLVVDDVIVVCENIYWYYEIGMLFVQVVIKGIEQIMLLVCVMVMMIVVVFLLLFIMEGLLGEFMGIILVVVIFVLFVLFVEFFFVLLSYVVEWGGKCLLIGFDEMCFWFYCMLECYCKMLCMVLWFCYLVVVLVIVVVFGLFVLVWFGMDFVFFGGCDLSFFLVVVEVLLGVIVEEMMCILSEIEEKVFEFNGCIGEVDSICMEVGGLQCGGMNCLLGINFGEVIFDLVDINDCDCFGLVIVDDVCDFVGDVIGVCVFNIEELQEGFFVGKFVQVCIIGDNFDILCEILECIKMYLYGVDGVKDIIDSFFLGKDEVCLVFDFEKIVVFGFDVCMIVIEICGVFDGFEVMCVYDGDEEIEVMVKYDEVLCVSLLSFVDMQFVMLQGMVFFVNVVCFEC